MNTILSKEQGRALANAPRKKRNKFNARKMTVDGFTYDSEREAEVVEGYRQLERAGHIYELERHKKYMLQSPNGTVIGHYEADAAFYDAKLKRYRIIDVKGKDTSLSLWKRKHVRAQYGIEVEVVR